MTIDAGQAFSLAFGVTAHGLLSLFLAAHRILMMAIAAFERVA